MTSATELLPCPFCGGEADISDEGNDTEPERYWAYCTNPSCFVEGTAVYATEAEAIAAWNTRAERTCKREKHGRKMDGSWRMRCSECGYGIGDKRWNFCPKCGAKVVG